MIGWHSNLTLIDNIINASYSEEEGGLNLSPIYFLLGVIEV